MAGNHWMVPAEEYAMGQHIGSELPANAVNYMRGAKIVVVATVDADGRPDSAPFSWVVAKDNRTVRIGMHEGIASLENIRRNGFASLTITAADLHVTFGGKARVVRDQVDGLPFSTAVVEVAIDSVRDDAKLGPADGQNDHIRWTERRQLVSDSTIVQALLSD